MNKCPYCNEEISSNGALTKKNYLCEHCKNEYFIIQKPISVLKEILFGVLIFSILILLEKTGIIKFRLSSLGFGSFGIFGEVFLFIILCIICYFFILIKFPLDSFIIAKNNFEDLEAVNRAARINLMILILLSLTILMCFIYFSIKLI